MRIVGITGGVDTHADTHVAAAVDHNGGLLGIESFPADASGFEDLLGWLVDFGEVEQVGVEGTGSWGVGLARFLGDQDIEVVEVDRPNRQTRRREGKSDPTDAVSAARSALSGVATTTPKSRNGRVEQMRVLLVARRSARQQRIQTLNQLRHLVFTAPESIRVRFKDRYKTGLPLHQGWGLTETAALCTVQRPDDLEVGDLVLDENDLALRGLIVRHLVMPGGIGGSRNIMEWVARELGPNTYVNVMAQYYPAGKVSKKDYVDINRHITPDEFQEALAAARAAGLQRLDTRSAARLV